MPSNSPNIWKYNTILEAKEALDKLSIEAARFMKCLPMPLPHQGAPEKDPHLVRMLDYYMSLMQYIAALQSLLDEARQSSEEQKLYVVAPPRNEMS